MTKVRVVLCVLAMVSLSAWAQNASKAGARASEAVSDNVAPPAVVKHVLKNMYNNTGTLFITTVVGYNAIDSKTTVSCPGTSGTCLIQADQWVQWTVPSNDEIGICLLVDGADINGCPINSSVPTLTGSYTVNNISQGKTVPFGNHTVQTFVYDDNGGTVVAFYNSNYYVFKP